MDYFSPDGLFEDCHDPEEDEIVRQRKEDEAMENTPDGD